MGARHGRLAGEPARALPSLELVAIFGMKAGRSYDDNFAKWQLFA
jgi:hypothetical protein